MKTKNIILAAIIASATFSFTSCSTMYDANYNRPEYHRPPGHIINDPDLPPVPDLSPWQIDKIKNIRREERRRVENLEIRKSQILAQLNRPERPNRPDRPGRPDGDRPGRPGDSNRPPRPTNYGEERHGGSHNNYDKDRERLERELRKIESRINEEHRRADSRVYSVLTPEQRRYLR